MDFKTLKVAVFAPIPSARVTTTTIVTVGVRNKERIACGITLVPELHRSPAFGDPASFPYMFTSHSIRNSETNSSPRLPIYMEEIARDVAVVPLIIVNAYLVGNSQNWVLIDSGTSGNAKKIHQAAEARFGPNTRPKAIILTHGHFDHAGSALDLAKLWNVKVYAHRLEWPYLTEKTPYPPIDPTAPGFFSAISRFFPNGTANLTGRLADLNGSLPELGLTDWEMIATPGHTPGHVSFFRRADSVLLAGDALTTVNLDNLVDVLTQKSEIYRPPVPATTDWQQARASVQSLAALRPRVIGAGHGSPMANVADKLQNLAANFPIPRHGRYVNVPARSDENGITYLPPAPPDHAPKIAAGIAVGSLLAFAGVSLVRKKIPKRLT